jgi:hypothetical protein
MAQIAIGSRIAKQPRAGVAFETGEEREEAGVPGPA